MNPVPLGRMIQRASDVPGVKRELTRGVYATLCDKEAEQAPVIAARFLSITPHTNGAWPVLASSRSASSC